MLQETLDRINDMLQHSENLSEEERQKLLALHAELQQELMQLAATQQESAQSIAAFAKCATHESLRAKKDQKLQRLANEGLQASIEQFETSHPRLTLIVQGICKALSGFGV